MTSPVLRIGSRGSKLALRQAEMLRERLMAAHPELAAPDAIERGARKIVCQMKRKLIRRPSPFGP